MKKPIFLCASRGLMGVWDDPKSVTSEKNQITPMFRPFDKFTKQEYFKSVHEKNIIIINNMNKQLKGAEDLVIVMDDDDNPFIDQLFGEKSSMFKELVSLRRENDDLKFNLSTLKAKFKEQTLDTKKQIAIEKEMRGVSPNPIQKKLNSSSRLNNGDDNIGNDF